MSFTSIFRVLISVPALDPDPHPPGPAQQVAGLATSVPALVPVPLAALATLRRIRDPIAQIAKRKTVAIAFSRGSAKAGERVREGDSEYEEEMRMLKTMMIMKMI